MAFAEVSTRRLLVPLAAMASLFLACACDEKAASPSTQSARRVVTTGPAGTGIIRGTVWFRGTPPEGEAVDGARCHAGAGTIRVSAIEIAPGGGLKDVMVYLKDPSTVPAVDERLAAPVLDQVNCQYTPRVLGVRAGQVLKVKSSDPTMHNVHTLSDRNPRLNFGMTGAGQSRDVSFAAPEQFTVRCDVHPWMSATVYVFDHPFFAVTGADGRFEIAGLPPGEHDVVFSHPFLGERTRKVIVSEAAVTADVTFERGQ